MKKLKPLPSLINGVKIIQDLGMNSQIPSKRIALFQCVCGNNFIGRVNAVKVGHKTSCGCKKDGHPTHGLSKHPLYRKWSGMITRIENPKDARFHRYGGRGIVICEEWRNNFLSFYNWAISNGWQKGLTIDRKNNDGNYEPNNCHFIPMIENSIKDQIKFKPNNEQIKQICNLYLNFGYTVTYLAKTFFTHKENISKLLIENNIKIDKGRRLKKCMHKQQ